VPPKGVPLTPADRIGLFYWVLESGVAAVAEDLAASVDSVANWISGLTSPFPIAHRSIVRKVRARAPETAAALREAARSVSHS